jgi:hypothetical protein
MRHGATRVPYVRHRGYLDRMHDDIGESGASTGGVYSPKAAGVTVVSDIVDRRRRW